MAATIVVAISLPGPARAQSSADAAPVILLHPGVPTILQLPDEIVHARVHDRDELRVAVVGDKLVVRPWPGTPVGMEALLDVETRTARWTFRLRVVARARDASREFQVPPVEAPATPVEAPATEESTAEAPPEVSAEPVVPPEATAEPKAPLAVTSEAGAPAASAPTSTSSPAPAEPEPTAAPPAERATLAAWPPRIDLSVHAVVRLGVTALDLPGHEARTGLQLHNALGVRLAGAPRGGWWELELDVSGERLAGLLTYRQTAGSSELAVSGTWLRAMLGMKVQFGTIWIPSLYAGIGAQAHLRESKALVGNRDRDSSTMKRGGVLALGAGLQYRAGDILLGVEFRVWEGGPDGYRSIAALLTLGCFLDQGDAR